MSFCSLYGLLCCRCLHLSCNAWKLETKNCTKPEQVLWDQVKSMSLNMGKNGGCFIFARMAIDTDIMHQKINMHIYFFS